MDKKKLNITQWAEEDRPREKVISKGLQALSDAELIAIIIGSGNREESAVQLSQRILHHVDNNLNALGKLSVKELIKEFKGVGEAKAVSICAALELGRRRGGSEPATRKSIRCSNDAYLLFYPILCDLPHEELWAALLNRSGKVIEKIRISQGGATETTADIRIILKAAITSLASSIVLCHNHPSGNATPSVQDDALTRKLRSAAKLLDISLSDHIIIADTKYYSYADEGRLE